MVNVHERMLGAPSPAVAALISTLSGVPDRLWPHDLWPPMELSAGLVPGSTGGHGPVRYTICDIVADPAGVRAVRFAFRRPAGFDGWHAFRMLPAGPDCTVLRHELRMTVRGTARLSWPLVFRPLHDALIEDALDRAQRELGLPLLSSARWSWRVRLLRRVMLAAAGTSRMLARLGAR